MDHSIVAPIIAGTASLVAALVTSVIVWEGSPLRRKNIREDQEILKALGPASPEYDNLAKSIDRRVSVISARANDIATYSRQARVVLYLALTPLFVSMIITAAQQFGVSDGIFRYDWLPYLFIFISAPILAAGLYLITIKTKREAAHRNLDKESPDSQRRESGAS